MFRAVVVAACTVVAACDSPAPAQSADAGSSGSTSREASLGGGAGGRVGATGGAPAAGGGSAAGPGSEPGDGSTSSAKCSGGRGLTSIVPLDAALKPSSMAVDGMGNVYVAGSFTGTATLGKTKLTATGSADMFLAKLDTSGNVVSATHWGAPKAFEDTDPMLAADAAGNVYMASFFSDTIDFGGTTKPLSAILVDAFAVKFDPTGKALWSERFGYDEGGAAILSIALAPNGDPVVAGTAAGTVVIGDRTWEAPDPPGSGNNQGFVARLAAKDGSVVWSNASGGSVNFDHVIVAVDSMSRTFLAARDLSGVSSRWGKPPGTGELTLRVGFDPSGSAVWSRYDQNALPTAESIDAAGRVAVYESNLLDSVVVGGEKTFSTDESMLALLFDPADGTLLSGTTIPQALPLTSAGTKNGFTFVSGEFTARTETFGDVTLSLAGVAPVDAEFFLAELDPAARFVWAAGMGAGETDPIAMAVSPAQQLLVVGKTSAAFATPAGSVPAGNFFASFEPPTCANDLGATIPAGDGSRGALVDAGAASTPDASPAMCPATQAEATNGAPCPVAMGCSYGTTCSFCMPKACNGQPTLWTYQDLGTPAADCPATPPAPGSSCPDGARCNYCLPGGLFFANCTAGGWGTGYSQILCN